MTRSALLLSAVLGITVVAACSTDATTRKPRTGAKRTTTDPVTGKELPDYNDPRTPEKEGLPDPFEGLPRGQEQINALCQRVGITAGSSAQSNEPNPNFNAVTNAFCREQQSITSIADVQKALGLSFTKTDAQATNGSNGNPGFALLSHSSSLIARNVSAINPRAFIFSPPPGQPVKIPGFVVMGFSRGEPFLEVAAQQPKNGDKISFYLIRFTPECEETNSCKPGDLLTPAIEKNWKSVTVYDDEDLKNSLADCRHCHQPDGPGTKTILRMQELQDPWTHWFRNDRPGGVALLQDFFRAHGTNEDYGGIPAAIIGKSDGRALEDLVTGQGFGTQPNGFDSKVIEKEIEESSSKQPEINTPPGQSSTWKQLYQASINGQFIPPPYHDVKVTDPDKLQFATDEYKKFLNGGPASALPDIRRVFLDDALEDLTFLPKSGLNGRQVLMQTCAQCHNNKLDQTISRAKFDVTALDSMSRQEKDLAIQRLLLPAAERLHMPPASMRTLPDDARQAAIDELKK